MKRRLFFPTFLLTIVSLALASAECLAADYIGSEACGQCHETEFKDWQGSHHQLAMAEATSQTVLGNFNNQQFTYNGIVSRFFREEDKYLVTTDNSAGELETFEVSYTFGWEPLQQYLVSFDDGRMQALSLAWDSRPESEGGQKWFHLYPDESVHSDDVLHWTRYGQNWNTNCAECHSTNLEKNYQPETNSFATTWDEISVGCEACHGAGSDHLAWAANQSEDALKGFTISVQDTLLWQRAPEQNHSQPVMSEIDMPRQQEVCASCHSRRFKWQNDDDIAFDNNHQLQLVNPGLYHADGQILDEVYVYGSFLQSKMHAQGVTCSNCHNPHTAELKAQDNGLCLQCHSPQAFNSVDHHLHPTESTGAQCVNCHMPQTTYMVVDPRADHSIRIPRPDLSIDSDIPNACNQCHIDETASWAANILESQFGEPDRNYAESLTGIWGIDSTSLNRLFRVIRDDETPEILKASGIRQLSNFADPRAMNVAINELSNPSVDARLAAIEVVGNLSLQQRFQHIYPLIYDENPVVRHQATASLREVPTEQIPTELQEALLSAYSAYEDALKMNLDNPSIASQLGTFYQAQRRYEEAVRAYQQANIIEPSFVPGLLNLADVYRLQENESLAIETLLRAEQVDDSMTSVKYALGLAYVRTGEREVATRYFEQASQLAPNRSDLRYAWVLSLFESGRQTEAIEVTLQGLTLQAEDEQLLYALAYFYEQTGDTDNAIIRYRELLTINPNHPGAAQQLRNLGTN